MRNILIICRKMISCLIKSVITRLILVIVCLFSNYNSLYLAMVHKKIAEDLVRNELKEDKPWHSPLSVYIIWPYFCG